MNDKSASETIQVPNQEQRVKGRRHLNLTDGSEKPPGEWNQLEITCRGDEITVQAGDQGIRFLLVSGKPIEEPVAWYGPIVMNTQAQLRQAMAELNDGTFIKHR